MTLQESTGAEPEENQQPEQPILVDSNKIRKEILKAFKEMENIDEGREELNAQANEIRSKLKNKGIPTKSFNAAYSRYKLDEDKRNSFDFAFRRCCEAGGVWFQADMVDEIDPDMEDDGDPALH